MARKLILDVDTGIDDALAIAYALASPELELIGVTCTYGNVEVDQAVRNSLAILELFGRPDIPVYAGPQPDGFEVMEISQFIHGVNGVGEAPLYDAERSVEPASAVDFMVRAAHHYGDDLVIVPVGPLTTVADAVEQDPAFAERAHIVCMGGALTVPGNVTAYAEANINQDPDGADRVFRACEDITMIGLDVTLQTLLTVVETEEWEKLNTAGGDFLAKATNYYIKAYETTAPHLGGCGLHDPLAVAVAADPTLVSTLPINLKVDTDGPTRGRTIGDEMCLNDPVKSAHVAIDVDVERFLAEFMQRLTGLARETPVV